MNQDPLKVLCPVSESPEATERIGRSLGSLLMPGDIVLLDGDLGAGKTVLTRGIASGLGLKPDVASPTYTLVFEHEAEGRGTDLFHFDVYRITGTEEFLSSGLDEYFERGGVCVIEWGTKVEEALPVEPIRAWLKGTGAERTICLRFPAGDEMRLARFRELLTNQPGIRL
ncbi:MAG: tRNA (adenosine(37)-N6)-threonylcarbamoyltransferase complex ATPase subunit type 1 TsaE [Clostridiaceae bacterium]|jgi:tRNA threonylcarbamoyladenosine biosynthesis protein TsaE|nr:tRNA (adenosine(37)-N6)-threonylcarbamoyltransferase complex ATPase subunit type 1 TsaE [Clostridiaceae bacterium]